MAGVSLCIAGAVVVYFEYVTHWFYFVGGLMFVVGSVLDILDGALARRSGKGTPFGAFLDSTVDRVGEGFMLGAVGLVMMRDGYEWGVAAAFAAIGGSFLVSYTRARAEALGLKGDVGHRKPGRAGHRALGRARPRTVPRARPADHRHAPRRGGLDHGRAASAISSAAAPRQLILC